MRGWDMSQDPERGPLGPRDDAPWPQATWQPEPGVVPLPVQRHPADPQLPGWAIAEPGAPSRLTPREQPVGRGKPSQAPDHTMRWVVVIALLAGAVVAVGIVVGGRLVGRSVEQEVGTVPDVRVTAQLIAAGHAMDLYRAEARTAPADLTPLAEYGYRPDDKVTVRIVPVTGTGYCLAGGPVGAAPTLWYSDAGGLSHTPCG